MILIYAPCGSQEEAERIALHLLNKRLVKCVNLHQIRSLYRWKGEVRNEPEVVMLAKARDDLFTPIKEEIEGLHSYGLPCIISIPVADANEKYKYWVETLAED